MPGPNPDPLAQQHCVLLTGFDPFGGQPVNPSWQAVQMLHGATVADHRIVAAQLPTIFGRSVQSLRGLLRQHRPTLVVCTGQAGGRGALSLERVAINVDDARIPDNAGAQPVDAPVAPSGPAAYFTGLPIKAMLAALLAEGVHAEVSQTAGTFVCNHLFYGLMHELATDPQWRGVRGGFVHVPWLPEQGQPSMRADEIARGLRVAIATALARRDDIRMEAGALN
ncbi:MAG: pyroglutamyl-peptidase I [Pseudomonadota bacterium]